MPSAWVEHIKEFAKRKGLTYGCALSDPECSAEYKAKKPPKTSKKAGGAKSAGGAEKENISMTITEKKARGRPKKYATEEERKKAKSAKTIESNKRKKASKSAGGEKKEPEPTPDEEELKMLFKNLWKQAQNLSEGFPRWWKDKYGEDPPSSPDPPLHAFREVFKKQELTASQRKDIIEETPDFKIKERLHNYWTIPKSGWLRDLTEKLYREGERPITLSNDKMRLRRELYEGAFGKGVKGGMLPSRSAGGARRERSETPPPTTTPPPPTTIDPPSAGRPQQRRRTEQTFAPPVFPRTEQTFAPPVFPRTLFPSPFPEPPPAPEPRPPSSPEAGGDEEDYLFMIGEQVEKIVNSREDPKKVRAMLRKLLKQVKNTFKDLKKDFADYLEILGEDFPEEYPEEVIQEKLMRLNSIFKGDLIEEERVLAGAGMKGGAGRMGADNPQTNARPVRRPAPRPLPTRAEINLEDILDRQRTARRPPPPPPPTRAEINLQNILGRQRTARRPPPAPPPARGSGLLATHSAEDAGGLTHIYPLSHAHILEMCKHLI
jgi:hypothetical protein